MRDEAGDLPDPSADDPRVRISRRITDIANSRLDLDRILQSLLQVVVEVTSCEACLAYLAEPDTSVLVLRASWLPHPTEIGKVRLALREGVTGWAAEHRQIVAMSHNAFADMRFKKFTALLEDSFQALLSLPLLNEGELVGVLNIHHREAHPHTADELLLMTFVGQQLGSAIALSRLRQENEQLQALAEESRRLLEERKLVERAKGILQERYKLTEEQAYHRLRNESRRSRKPIRDLAEAILLVEGMGQQK